LDIGYVCRWRVMRDVQIGFKTGLGLNYASTKASADLSNQFDRTEPFYNIPIHYTTTAHAIEQHSQLGLELPLMFAFQAKGFALNIGPKLLYMAMDKYSQTIDTAKITATIAGVPIPDVEVIGRIKTPYTQQGSNALSPLHVLLSAEIGYEWQIGNHYSKKNEQFIGIQLYADYGLWSLNNKTSDPFIAVTPIQPGQTAPQITIGSIFQSESALRYFSAGLRIYYTIQTVDYPGHGWHKARK